MMQVPLRAIVQSLTQAPRMLEALTAEAPKQALSWREGPGAWTVVEVLAHMADGEVTDWMPRIETILSGGGRFTPYDREGGFVRYRGWAAGALVGEFTKLRRQNLEKLAAMHLTPAHMASTGVHPEFGSVTLEQLVTCWATHDMAHMAQISRILTRWFGRGVGPWAKYFSLLREEAREAQA